MPNRYICSVLDEARDCIKHMNILTLFYSKRHMKVLIEEIQTLANRMESALYDQNNIETMHKKKRTLKREIKELESKRDDLKDGERPKTDLENLLDEYE